MTTQGQERRDRVDGYLDFLRGQNPARAIAAKALVLRLRRTSHYIEREVRRELAPLAIELWEFEVLAALRRAGGPPCQLTAGALMTEMQLTSGAITKQIAHLERKGWVRREIDPADRRRILVTLTDAGFARATAVFDVIPNAEQALTERLDAQTLDRLNNDLRTLLLLLEDLPSSPSQ